MTTSKRNGFFTASCLILLLCLSVLSGTLDLVRDQGLTAHAISWYDRQFFQGREVLRQVEAKLRADSRFPDHAAFVAYVEKYPREVYVAGSVELHYLGKAAGPLGGGICRLSLKEVINGIPILRPVRSRPSGSGLLCLELAGIAP